LVPIASLIELSADTSSGSILGVIALLGVLTYVLYQYGALGWLFGHLSRAIRWSIRTGFFGWEATFAWASWLVYLAIAIGLLAVGVLVVGFAPYLSLLVALAVIYMGVTACLAYMYIDLERYEVERGYKAVHNPLKGQELAPHLAQYGHQVDFYLLFSSTIATIGGFALLNQALFESIGGRWFQVHERAGYSDFLTYAFLNLLRVVDVLDVARSQKLLEVSLVRPAKWPASTLIVLFRTFFTLVLLQQIFASIRQGRLLAETIADFWSPHEPIQQRARNALPQYGATAIGPLLLSCRGVNALTKEQRAQLPEILAAIGPTTIPTLIRHLHDPNEHVRAVSAVALGHLNAREALPALAGLSEDPSDHVRLALAESYSPYVAAARRVDKLPGARPVSRRRRWFRRSATARHAPFDPMPGLVSGLQTLLGDPSAAVRTQAAAALGAAGESAAPAVPDLISRLRDADESVRCEAAQSLGKVGAGGDDALRALATLLDDPSAAVRAAAARGLGAMGEALRPAIPNLVPLLQDPDETVRAAAADALSVAGPLDEEATASLVGGLASPDNVVRAQAAEALGAVDAPAEEAAEALAAVLRDDNDVVRQKAAEALGKIGEAAADVAVPRLVKALRDPDSWVSALSAEALGEMGDAAEGAVPALVRAVSHVNVQVRANAAGALGKLGPAAESARPVLERATADAEGSVRAAAVRALASLGTKSDKAYRLVREALTDPDPQVRVAGVDAIGMANRSPAEVERLLVPLLTDATDAVKSQAALALARHVGPVPAVVDGLCRILVEDDSTSVQANAALAIARLGPGAAAAGPALARAAQTGEAAVREQAMKALAIVLPTESAEAFQFGLKDPSAEVRIIASAGWLKLSAAPAEAIPVLVAALKDPEAQVRANAALVLSRQERLPPDAVPLLLECTTEPSDSLRINAVLALRKAPTAQTDTVMRHLLDDPNGRVRVIAAGALLAADPDDGAARAVAEAARDDPSSPRVRQAATELLASLAAKSEETPATVEPAAGGALQMST
jgi:HEAT repeat protein